MAEAPEFYGGDGGGMVAVNPKPSKGFTSKAIDLLEKLFVKLMHDPSKPLHYLSGNFAPVREETPPVKDLPLQGYLPECLNGEFVRVGPNPKFDPVAGYHWFDGDGMIHGVRIKDGKATYVSRYVKTSRLKQEEFFGGAKFMKIGDLKGLFGLLMVHLQMLRTKLKVLDDSYGNGTANTALIYHHGKLLALQEADKPYVVKVLEDGDLQTLGMMDYDKRLTHSFTAHPKVDPITGEMFTFGYSHKPPYITYRVISKDGVMHDPVPITISEPIMMHDFAITENYAIFMDLPLHFKPKEMVKEKKMIYSFDPTKKARFGVLPRCAKDELLIRWFELPNCFIFHNANAWEEEDEVVLITCRLENPDLDMVSGNVKEKLENFNNELYEMRFNMATGAASQRKLSASAVDFPRVNECYTGRKQRYVYGTILDSIAKVTGIIKFDLHAEPEPGKTKLEVGGNIKGIFDLGPGRYGSEAIYVPRKPGYTAEEDDGYLIFFVHDENTGKSWVNVIDAKTMSADAVAVVELPHRVPYGFHAFFVAEVKSRITYVIKILEDGDLQTLGIMDYDKRLIHSITAHPKVDLVTGEMFTFGYSLKPPYVIYRVIPKDGLMHDPVSITISEPVMMHDFAITENYAIFMDLPMYFGPKVTVKGRPIYFYDVTKKACFGILPRYARDELQIRWYETRFNMVTGESQRGNYQLPLENFQGSTSATLAGGNIKGIFELGPSRYGWEAIFVPRQRGHTNEEDDGYLIFFVYDDLTGNKNNVR